MPTQDPATLLTRLKERQRGALSRLLTLTESEPSVYADVADQVIAMGHDALRVSITGAAGVGKSTLVDRLTAMLRARGKTVGVLATDPSSEQTGGALLGDRVRFSGQAPDDGLFFRSVANRGATGGLSAAVHDQLDLLDAFSLEVLLLEAVGAGQSEIDVAFATDLVIVVSNPSAGDTVQAMKAGLMEVGDIFCINKADLPGADRAVETLQAALELRSSGHDLGPPPVLAVSALKDEGIDRLLDTVFDCAARIRDTGDLDRRRRTRQIRRVRTAALRLIEEQYLTADALKDSVARSPGSSPHQIARELLQRARPDSHS